MKAQKFALMAFIAMLLLTSMSAVVRAQDGDDASNNSADIDASASGANTVDPNQAQADKEAAAQLAKEERKRAAR